MSVWKYKEKLQPVIEKNFQISFNEGNTPLESYLDYAKEIGLKNLYLKREDQNPTGSHKDRSLIFQISAHMQNGKKEFVISSSGNAAISAIKCALQTNITLHIYLSHKLSESKLLRLNQLIGDNILPIENIQAGVNYKKSNLLIHFVSRPKVEAFRYAKGNNLVFLRGSTDDYAVEGFKTIAFEIYEKNKEIDSIFIPCSSGTSAEGIYQGFRNIKENLNEEDSWQIPQIHIVQTTKVNTIAKEFDKDYRSTENSLAKAIVDRVGHRKQSLIQHIKDTKGFGWIVNDKQITNGLNILSKLGVECSAEGGASMGALLKALERSRQIENPVVLITGRK